MNELSLCNETPVSICKIEQVSKSNEMSFKPAISKTRKKHISKYRGVSCQYNSWRVRIGELYIGKLKTITEAIQVYNEEIVKIEGKKAVLHKFPTQEEIEEIMKNLNSGPFECDFITDNKKCGKVYSNECTLISHVRNKHKKKRKIIKVNFNLEEENSRTDGNRKCTNIYHHNDVINSPYLRNYVPVDLFKENDDIFYSHCFHCREYDKKRNDKYKEKYNQIIINGKKHLEENNINHIQVCTGKNHSKLSDYPITEVPVELFMIEPENPKSPLYSMCVNCRYQNAQRETHRVNTLKIKAEEKNLILCYRCKNMFNTDKMSINYDGTFSKSCVPCKKLQKQNRIIKRQYYLNIKLEFIERYQSSCQKCNYIYIKPLDNSIIVRQLEIYENNGLKYVNYLNTQYLVVDFINNHKDLLELDILHMDHLTEQEQRDRQLLLPHEPYIKKKKNVSMYRSEGMIRLESLKCQLLCAKCHVETTIEREKGLSEKAGLVKKKFDYINSLKIKGCSVCKYKNADLLRVFHMDHIIPNEKKCCVSQMIRNNTYSMDDVINECDKCRVLCYFCHVIHTRNQINQGMFLPKRKTSQIIFIENPEFAKPKSKVTKSIKLESDYIIEIEDYEVNEIEVKMEFDEEENVEDKGKTDEMIFNEIFNWVEEVVIDEVKVMESVKEEKVEDIFKNIIKFTKKQLQELSKQYKLSTDKLKKTQLLENIISKLNQSKTCSTCNLTKIIANFRITPGGLIKLSCKICENAKISPVKETEYQPYTKTEIIPEIGTKKCTHCKEIFSKNDFYKNKANPDGLESQCINCSKIRKYGKIEVRQIKKVPRQIKKDCKWCPECETEKLKSEFHKAPKRPDGLNYNCKECYNNKRKQSRLKNKLSKL